MPRRHSSLHLLWWAIACAAGIVLFASVKLFGLRTEERDTAAADMSNAPRIAAPRDDRLERRCAAAVDRLVDLNVNFLAVDFDQTMIDVHTGGRWKESAAELAPHLRPLFLRLVPLATSRNLRIAIVTFSPQTDHIREVLEFAFPDVAEHIVIRGNDLTWEYQGSGMRHGKQPHMASATEELLAAPALGVREITRATTLLIDDDPKNIKKALEGKTRAVWFDPRRPDRLLDDIMQLE